MPFCHVCRNEYDKCFSVDMQGAKYWFDSFECAIHALAPVCRHCGVKVVGHGLEKDGIIYCCASCAHHVGVDELVDRA